MAYEYGNQTRSASALDQVLTGSIHFARKLIQGAKRTYQHLENRRGVEEMLHLDDAVLRDIGLERADVRWAARLPLSCKAGEELAKATGRRNFRPRHPVER